MKKLHFSAAAAALVGSLAMVPMQAEAFPSLNFLNTDTLGGSNSYVNVFKLNTNANIDTLGAYTTFVQLGADNALSVGDVFTESFLLTSVASQAGGLALSGDYNITVSLTGKITNLYGAGALTVDNLGPAGATRVINTGVNFDIAFTNANLSLYDAKHGAGFGTFITTMDFISGGAGAISLVAGSLISPVTLNTALNCTSTTCDPYVKDALGNTLNGTSPTTVTTGSTRFVGFDGTTFVDGGTSLFVNFLDNGEATTFPAPEPGVLSLVGLGLLGLGFRKAKKSA